MVVPRKTNLKAENCLGVCLFSKLLLIVVFGEKHRELLFEKF